MPMPGPYVYQNNALIQPNTSTKYIGGQGNHPRTAIYTSKAIKAWNIESISHRDLTAIVVKINNRETLIMSIYLDRKLCFPQRIRSNYRDGQ